MMWTVTMKGLKTSVSFRAQHMPTLSKQDMNDVDSDLERVKNECIFQGPAHANTVQAGHE